MNKALCVLLVSFFVVIFFFTFPNKVSASVIFQDDFSQYADNSFPSQKWIVHNQPATNTCGASWTVHNGEVGISINQSNCTAHLIPNSTFWPNALSEYVLDFDVRFVSGTDRHIDYRIVPQAPFYRVIHFAIPGDFSVDSDNQNFVVNVPKQYSFNTKYHFKLVVTNNRLKVYESDLLNPQLQLIRDITHNTSIPPGTIGLGSNPGSGSGVTETWFDNVVVSSIDHDLNVPSLKQTSAPWGNQLYDSANLWALPEPTDISRWGCALTSAAMVFQYNKISRLPDGSDLDPKGLNTWLKSQGDGYVGNGLVNWLALQRLSHVAKSKNPNFLADGLKYNRVGGADINGLKNDIQDEIPNILEEPGHFIVAKGIDGLDEVGINDPFYSKDKLSDYSNVFLSRGRFVPTFTDFSYIMAIADDGINFELKNSQQVVLGDSFTQQPLVEDGGSSKSAGPPLSFFYLDNPENGNYFIKVSSSQSKKYNFKLYLYDKDGNYKILSFVGIVDSSKTDDYSITINKDNVNKSTAKKEVTFDSFINDINYLCNSGEIKIYCPAILAQAKTAKGAAGFNPTVKAAISILKALDNQIGTWKRKGVSQAAYNILHSDLQTLISSL